MLLIVLVVVLGAAFLMGVLMGQQFKNREVEARQRDLAVARRQVRELLRDLDGG